MKSKVQTFAAIVGLGLMVGLAQHSGAPGSSSGSAVAPKAVSDGVYTARQAERGKPIYQASCAGCHGADLKGPGAPALTGEAFKTKWKAATLGSFFEYVKTRMPAGKPNSLSAQAYADVVAYVLQLNGYTAGRSLLPPDVKALNDFAFDKAAQAAAVAAASQPQTNQTSNQPVAPSVTSGPRTANDGVFTDAQAERGRVAYLNPSNGCSGCHGAEMGGSPGGPGLVRASFKNRWSGKTVGELFSFTKAYMPPGRTGSLPDKDYIDIVAFILKANNFRAGTVELTDNLEDLKLISIPQ